MAANRKFDAVLCDIEGTTTSISFVKDVLFPYCSNNVEEYLKKAVESNQHLITSLMTESNTLNQSDSNVDLVNDPNDYQSLAKNVKYFIQQDLKLTALKELQGQMWIDGYRSGAYKSHVYDDTVKLFEYCRLNKIPLFIYSSGSVLAQKLLFEHTEKGDLTSCICDYYDTNFGAKTDQTSYRRIAAHIRLEAKKILFLSDVDKEAFAAREAGMNVILLIRDGNTPLSEECKKEFQVIHSFDELKL